SVFQRAKVSNFLILSGFSKQAYWRNRADWDTSRFPNKSLRFTEH
ncbi:unnamed protein product, partial [Gulo gulo]